MKNNAAAAAEFQGILDRRGEVPTSMLYPLSYLGLARAKRDTDRAASDQAYAAFIDLWSNADTDLQPLAAKAATRVVRRQKMPNTIAGKNAEAASENEADTSIRMSAGFCAASAIAVAIAHRAAAAANRCLKGVMASPS